MKRVTSIKLATGFIIVLISLIIWSSTQQIQSTFKRLLSIRISSTRTDSFNTYCNDKSLSKSNLVDQTILASVTTKRNSLYQQWGLDGSIMTKEILRGNTSKFFSNMNGSLFWYMGVFLLPFIIFIAVAPFLLSCCVCPNRFPLKSCRKQDSEKYTKCQLMWPVIILMMSLVFTLGCSIYGLMNSSQMDQNLQKFGCSLALVSDEPLNGGYNIQKTSFFSGFRVLYSDLKDIKTNIANIRTQYADFINPTGTSQTHITNLDAVLTNIKKIPDGTGNRGATIGLKYDVPIDSSTPTVNGLVSTFDKIFGSYDQNQSLMKEFYSSVAVVKQYIQSIRENAQNLNTYSATIDPQISVMSFTAYLMQMTLDNLTKNFDGLRNQLTLPKDLGKVLVNFFYSFLICVCAVSMIGALGLMCCKKITYRFAVYTGCIFFFVFGVFSFLIAVLFSYIGPTLNWTCNFLDTALQSKAGFVDNLSIFLDSWTLTKLSPCMGFGDGDIISELTSDSTAAAGMRGLSDIIVTFGKFDSVALKDGISKNYTKILKMTGDIINGITMDLDEANINILKTVSNQKNAYLSDNCNSQFVKDSWIPSISTSQNKVTCNVQSGTGTKSTCATMTSIFCRGCMDSSQISGLYTTKSAFNDALDDKYSEMCNFNPVMSNIWANYYHKKIQILGAAPSNTVSSGPVSRINGLSSKLFGTSNADEVSKIINDFSATISNINTNLVAIKTLIDPKQGTLAGMNCKVLGEALLIVKNSICGGLYNDILMLRMTFGLTGCSLLLSMIFSVFTGYRYYQNGDKHKRVHNQSSKLEESSVKAKRQKGQKFNVQEIENDYSFENMKSKRKNPYEASPNQNKKDSSGKVNNSNDIFQDASIRYLKSKR